MAIQVNPTVSPRIITVPEADGDSITIQSLVNQIRDWEDNQANLAYPRLLSAAGKEVLDSETLVGITAKLENTKVKFADRTLPTDCDIYGGNLVAIDANGYPISPVQYAANVTVTLAKSSSATMVQSAEIDAIKAKTDHLPSDPAEQSLVQALIDAIGIPTSTIAGDVDAIETELGEIKGEGWTSETLKKIKELIEAGGGSGKPSFTV